MTSRIDELSPDFVGGANIKLTLSDPLARLVAFTGVAIAVDYSDTDDLGGIQMPLELIVSSPSPGLFQRQNIGLVRDGISQQTPPGSVSFVPREGGQFLVLLREVGHNRAYGTLTLTVEGTQADASVTLSQSA